MILFRRMLSSMSLLECLLMAVRGIELRLIQPCGAGTYPLKPSEWLNAIALYERLPPFATRSVRLVPGLHNVSLITQMLDAAWLL